MDAWPDFGDWCVNSRRITDKKTGTVGPFSLLRYPWLEFPYQTIGGMGPGSTVILKKCAQVGFTELCINVAFFAVANGANVFYALPPGKGIVGDFVHARIDTAIGDSPEMQGIAGQIDNVGFKAFERGNLYIRSTHIPKGDPRNAPGLAEVPVDVLIFDEFDRIPPAAVPLLEKRLSASGIKWQICGSTPTYPDVGIDSVYNESCRFEVQVTCQECGAKHWLDWKLVKPPIRGLGPFMICPSCGKEIDRVDMWSDGRAEWVARQPASERLGFWISRLADPGADLRALWIESEKKKEAQRQAFHNAELGIAYEPKGARLTKDLIASCVGSGYNTWESTGVWCAMGVDVGLKLHYWIKRRLPNGRERAVRAGEVMEWHELDVLMQQYDVQRCVVDDRPELRLDEQFQDRHRGKVALAQELDSPDAPIYRWVKTSGRLIVKIERTKALREASDRVKQGVDELPQDWESVAGLPEHLTAMIMVARITEDGRTVYHFPHNSKPDHLMHAKLFCEAAMSIMPQDPGHRMGGGSGTPKAGRRHTGL